MKKHRAKIEVDRDDGMKLGVQMTPSFFVNGVMLQDIGYAPIKRAIEAALSEQTK